MGSELSRPKEGDLYRGYFETRVPYDPRRRTVWREICRFLESRFMVPTQTVLELGSAYCDFINQVHAGTKIALDTFPDMADYADADVRRLAQSCADPWPLAGGSVDVIFASNLFEHLSREDFRSTISESFRALSSGGKLIILQPNFRYCFRNYFDDYTHQQIFTHVSLCDYLMAAGFRIHAVFPRFAPFSMKSGLPIAGWLVWAYLRLPVKPFAGQMLVVAEKS